MSPAARPETLQGGAIGAQQEGGLDEVALGLLDGERGKEAVVAGPLRHHAIHREAHLLLDLRDGEFRHGHVAAPRFLQPGMGGADRPLATLHGDIHRLNPPRS
jgi:hypothetical protein